MKRVGATYKARSWRHYALLSFLVLVGFLLLGRIVFLGDVKRVFLQKAGKSSEKLEKLP